MAIQRLNELFAKNGMVGFRVTKRVDAKPTLLEAFKCRAKCFIGRVI